MVINSGEQNIEMESSQVISKVRISIMVGVNTRNKIKAAFTLPSAWREL